MAVKSDAVVRNEKPEESEATPNAWNSLVELQDQLSNKILRVQSAEKNVKVDKEELDETTLKFWGEPNEKSEDISVIKMLKLLSMRK